MILIQLGMGVQEEEGIDLMLRMIPQGPNFKMRIVRILQMREGKVREDFLQSMKMMMNAQLWISIIKLISLTLK